MFCFSKCAKFFHSSSVWLVTDKTLLAKLRKMTGYTFANCKKALEVNSNDVQKAEQWLKEQAEALGWAKAASVAGRATLQGLIAVKSDSKCAAMVELNCETDFVARNSMFRDIACLAANTCFSAAKSYSSYNNSISKMELDGGSMKDLVCSSGKKLSDEVAILISHIGENVSLRRALCISVKDDLFVSAHTHPIHVHQDILTGKYATILVYKTDDDNESVQNIGKQLCQHIIGMKPERIGDPQVDEPKESKQDEPCMIFQEFIMEPEIEVSQVLADSRILLVDYWRLECGEDLNPKQTVQQPSTVEDPSQSSAAARG